MPLPGDLAEALADVEGALTPVIGGGAVPEQETATILTILTDVWS